MSNIKSAHQYLLGALFLTAAYATTASAQNAIANQDLGATTCDQLLQFALSGELNSKMEYYSVPKQESGERSYKKIAEDEFAVALIDTLNALQYKGYEIKQKTQHMNTLFAALKGPQAMGLTGNCESYANIRLTTLPVATPISSLYDAEPFARRTPLAPGPK